MITATEISQWAATHPAQSQLPNLIRRLIGQTGSITSITMPAGSSVSIGGFDGEIFAEEGNTWVPKDKSVWELSVNATPMPKAEEDYKKRTKETSAEERANCTYIAVTGRKWTKREDWATKKRNTKEWKNVKVYDADDLELWLEQETPVQIWFAEFLGKPASFLKSPERYWQDWNRDVVPAITKEAVLKSRADEYKQLLKLIEDKKRGGTIVVHADSSEEAVAFACAAIMSSKTIESARALVVTDDSAWGSISGGSNINLAIAGNATISQEAPTRENLLLIVPFANGDSEAHFEGRKSYDVDPNIALQRTLPEAFRNSLEDMGIEHGDAQRLTIQCGRSWSVYRRLKNRNPALRQPTWVDKRYTSVLTTLALIGAFEEKNKDDLQIIEQISQTSPIEFINQAELLIKTDDAPIVRINGVLKAKSNLELFVVNEAGISDDMFERFIKCCEEIFEQTDPSFKVPKEERWMANVMGETRPQSGAIIKSLASALPRIAELSTSDIRVSKIDSLVRKLMNNASSERWFSLSPFMQELAEASPNEFLNAIENDLHKPDPQIFILFTETSSPSSGGGCVYANLLWALEILAWAPNYLLRVSRILATLIDGQSEGNWGNSPAGSLLSIYRSWKPQTSATSEMRNKAMTALIVSHPEATFSLTMGILHSGHDMASPSASPNWRDYDAGISETVTDVEYFEVLKHSSQIAFNLAVSSADKAMKLFERYDIFDDEHQAKVIEILLSSAKSGSTSEVRAIRHLLRDKIHRELNYEDNPDQSKLSILQKCYLETEPSDIIEKHQWLFENFYCELPEKESRKSSEQTQERLKKIRIDALNAIYSTTGLSGIEKLAEEAGNRNCVGQILHNLPMLEDVIIDWFAERLGKGRAPEFICEWLRSHNDKESPVLMNKIIDHGVNNLNWKDTEKLQFLQIT